MTLLTREQRQVLPAQGYGWRGHVGQDGARTELSATRRSGMGGTSVGQRGPVPAMAPGAWAVGHLGGEEISRTNEATKAGSEETAGWKGGNAYPASMVGVTSG